jgi:hypothetical protein
MRRLGSRAFHLVRQTGAAHQELVDGVSVAARHLGR